MPASSASSASLRRVPPWAWAVLAGVLSLLAAFAPTLWHMLTAPPGRPPADTTEPWRIAVGADGRSRALGLQLGSDTLGTLQARLGEALQPALVARRGEAGALEALVDPFSAGFVSGRLVLAFDAPPEALARWRDGAAKSDVAETGARRYTLSAAALQEAASAPLAGASFLPALALGEAELTQRFGAPAAVHAASAAEGEQAGVQTWLYPERGLAIALQPGRKAVLQYVAPADFERRLRAPLEGAAR